MATTTRSTSKKPKKERLPPLNYVSREEGVALLDRQARKYLGLSGEEFVRRYRAGDLRDYNHSDVMAVSMLIPFAEQ